MSQQLPDPNPYAPPSEFELSQPAPGPSREVHPLWIWLAIAVLTSFIGTPADPISTLLALAYGLLCFWIGFILGSRTHIVLRLALLALCVAAAAWLALLAARDFHAFFLVAIWASYGLISIGSGMWACRRIQHGRLRILAGFSFGYIFGSMLGPLGTVMGAVAGAVLARRSLPQPKRPNGS